MIRLALSALVGVFIVGGQLCLASFARALNPPWTPVNLLPQIFTSGWLYGAGLFYLVAIGVYLGLLRTGAISATNLPIMAIIVGLNIALAFTPGEALGATQIAGAVCVGIGLLLMQAG